MKEFYNYTSFAEGINNLAHKKIEIDDKTMEEFLNYMVYYYDNLNKNNSKDIEFMFNYLSSFFGPVMKELFDWCEIEEKTSLKKEELKDKLTSDVKTLYLKNSLLIHNNNCASNKIKVAYDYDKICKFYGYKEDSREYKIFYLLMQRSSTFEDAMRLYAVSFL